ncbi:MAG: polyprenyl synthetase family protein [Bryobacterales bacterium]|nr:polyprenyl synthetase family protein [Bryobacterales bacterium]
MAVSVTSGASLNLGNERECVERELAVLLAPSTEGDCGSVHDAMAYATLGGGKRIRPTLSLRVAQMLGHGASPLALRAAAAVELFHCASLIIDDLPCMDNESERRGRPTVHVAFDESTAVLAAFGLVALGSRCVLEVTVSRSQLPQLVDFQKRLLRTLDCAGLIAGQARDLTLCEASAVSHRAEVNEMKTVPLFELAVEAGMVGVDLDHEDRSRLRLFGREFGRAFQMVDDLLDGDADHHQPFLQHLNASRELLAPFGEGKERLLVLLDYLNAYANQKNHCHR